ncbi:hypothetical protein [Saccharomonospora sp. NB11]|jgi:hypothetical protein|uniref:hypothetical protein n=1 Tax=Saccharomonospora sp. NB11 TaxID=1642298 RepID=UPI0018D1EA53|nr:hypothetical protein [Saccharomonospora sp. NB11]
MTTALVWEGEADLPTVLVFDPAPASGPIELPTAWRALAETRQILWCRFDTDEALAEVDRLLADADAFGRPIDAVVHGDPADVVDVLRRHADQLRSIVVVDAEPDATPQVADVRILPVGRPATPPRAMTGDAVRAEVAAALDALDAGDVAGHGEAMRSQRERHGDG